MPPEPPDWQVPSTQDLPTAFLQVIQGYTKGLPGRYAAQLLWRRGIQDLEQLPGFLDPDRYQPAHSSEFGQEMVWAVERLQQAHRLGEKVAIWGDFDADGITATAVLWEGLGAFFPAEQQLVYRIPNRLTESHGLSVEGVAALANQGCHLIVTCDTGSTNLLEIDQARSLGMDMIVTDHHTLPAERPNVTAILNPRYLASDHPLFHCSGVAVAYKLVEALYEAMPQVPQHSQENLLDLVAIGLIADLVQLSGDCRYLAQRGLERLQGNDASRPGVARLLELCKRTGDRPTDISFGLGPRINAVSRIQGDARFCVELLTSRNVDRCHQLALETESANTRRKALQRDIVYQVKAKIAQVDLSTTPAIVLWEPEWPVGVLGIVAGQVAQEYGRPVVLLSTDAAEEATASGPALARGSARSVHDIDLYQLVKRQEHLLHRFGGHPFAAGLSLPVENLVLFAAAINQALRQLGFPNQALPTLQADLTVTVSELGKALFQELKLLEPCGMGNPVPRLLVRNCWFQQVRNRNLQDPRGGKLRYIKTEFELWDDTVDAGFPGLWWEHYQHELPQGRCDAIVELDCDTAKRRYEVRLVAVRPHQPESAAGEAPIPKQQQELIPMPAAADLPLPNPIQSWEQLVGIAKYLQRTGKTATRQQLCCKLGVSDVVLERGLQALIDLGVQVHCPNPDQIAVTQWADAIAGPEAQARLRPFLAALQEERFRRQYCTRMSAEVDQIVTSTLEPS